MLLCADYCSNFCLTKVDSADPCHPKVDADGDGVIDGKEEGVIARRQKNSTSATFVFLMIFGFFGWAAYHTSKARKQQNQSYQQSQQWLRTQNGEENQGISMVPQTWDEESVGGSLISRSYQRSESPRGTAGYY